MTQEIIDTIDKGNLAIGVFVYFQKAFDTVNHKSSCKNLNSMVLQTTDFTYILKKDNNMYLLEAQPQKLNLLSMESPKVQYLVHYFFLNT